jgi:hypothetical protein
METTTPQSEENKKVTIEIPTNLDAVVRKRPLVPASYGLGIVFFFFSFFVIKCGDTKIATISGVNLVTGKEITANTSFGNSGNSSDNKNVDPNVWAIIALSSAVIGLGVYLFKFKKEELVGTIVSGLGVVSLTILGYTFKDSVNEADLRGMVTVSLGFGYWGALVCILLAGVLSFLRLRIKPKPVETINYYQQPTKFNPE